MARFYVTISDELQKANGATATRFEEVGADDVEMKDGALVFRTGKKVEIVYAAGQWLCFTQE